MLWIKRNLFFVLSMVVGLSLTGWAGYDFYSVADKNSAVSGELKENRDKLKALKSKSPVPTPENIQAAKEDEKRVAQFLVEFRKAFVPFPVPPNMDEKGFKTFLGTTIEQLRLEATNAEVTLQPNYDFSFQAEMEKLSYHVEGIPLLLEQMEEIKVLCGILFGARIAALDGIQRVPVSEDDEGANDYLNGAGSETNNLGIVHHYKITFRGFSEQIADVLQGFARSQHLWIIKDVDVRPSTAPLPVVMPEQIQPVAPPPQMFMPRAPMADPRFERGDPRFDRSSRFGPGGGGYGRGPGPYDRPYPYNRPNPYGPVPFQAPVATGPVTILSPRILFVTLSVDLVKLKEPEVPTNKPPVLKPNVLTRGARPAPATP